jgi:hypothetical protein
LPGEYWKTAANLGLGGFTLFRLIEWPAMRRSVAGAAGLVFMLCATSFTLVLVLGGGPAATTLEVAIYQALRFDFDPNRAVLLSGDPDRPHTGNHGRTETHLCSHRSRRVPRAVARCGRMWPRRMGNPARCPADWRLQDCSWPVRWQP